MKLGAMLAVSLAAHAVAGYALATLQRPAVARVSVVEMSIQERPAPPPPPSPPPKPEPPTVPETRPTKPHAPRPRAVRPVAPPASVSNAPAIEVPAAPVDFTAGPAISSESGRDDPGPAAPAPRATRGGSGTVALADLSRPPSPPALDDALARRYPAAARAAGRTGRAVVRLRIDPDGRARMLRLLSATEPPFGDACRATVDGSRWRPPLDAAGKPVATEVTYTCSFQIAP